MEKTDMQPDHPVPHIKQGMSKEKILCLADACVAHVLEEGEVFRVAEALAAMEEFARQVRKNEDFVQFLRDELMKHHGRMVTTSGAMLEICEAGTQYNYSSDGEWRMLQEQILALEEKKKNVEIRLKQLAPGQMVVDPDTGEVMEGPQRTSRSTYRITLSKR